MIVLGPGKEGKENIDYECGVRPACTEASGAANAESLKIDL